jgi:hypothetical protein
MKVGRQVGIVADASNFFVRLADKNLRGPHVA